jgi:hypothetical protein
MSRKASTTSTFFIPFEGIEVEVLQHKLEDYFGRKAKYSEAPSGDVSCGWAMEGLDLTLDRAGTYENTRQFQRYVKARPAPCAHAWI